MPAERMKAGSRAPLGRSDLVWAYREVPIPSDDLEPWEEPSSKYYYVPNGLVMGGLRGIGPRGLTDEDINNGAIERYQERLRRDEREMAMEAAERRSFSMRSLHE